MCLAFGAVQTDKCLALGCACWLEILSKLRQCRCQINVIAIHSVNEAYPDQLQSSEHQNDQTQEQVLPSGNPSHEHLTLNVEQTTLLYDYLFTTHTYLFNFKFAHLHFADAFIQSNLQLGYT